MAEKSNRKTSAGKRKSKPQSGLRTSKLRPTGKAKSPARTGVASRPRAAARRGGSQPAVGASKAPTSSQGDWRAKTLDELRRVILDAAEGIVEERKWKKPSNPAGVPVWSHTGIICTGETYKEVVKLTFARGASLPDPRRLFNAGLAGGTRRAIDIRQGESLDLKALRGLVQAAIAENQRVCAGKSPKARTKTAAKARE